MTVSIYQDTPNGRVYVGTFTHRGRPSVRVISEAFKKKYPEAESVGKLYVAQRRKLMGEWVDGELLPMD
jgi:hypothetical protein